MKSKPNFFGRVSTTLTVFAAIGMTQTTYAADAAWNVDAAGSWVTASSWNPAAAPGSTVTTNSTDIATFSKTLTAGRVVTVDSNRNIGTITFDHSDAFAYTFSTTGNLRLTNGGLIQSATTNGNHQDAVVTRIDIQGDGGSATFTSSATSSSSLLTIGNSGTSGTVLSVQGVSTVGNTTTLNLNGNSVGTGTTNGTTNSVVGRITDGTSGGKLSIAKSGVGTWRISGDNQYTGGTTVSAGTLNVGRVTALGTGAVVNNATIDIATNGNTITGFATGLSGSGIVNFLGANMGTGATNTTLTLSTGTYTGFSGTWNIGTGAAAGAGRATMNGASNSSSTVNVAANATVFVSSATTHNASITLNGGDTGESFGQLRLEGNSIWAGSVTLAGDVSGTGDGNVGANTNQSGTISGIIGESGGSRVLTKVGAGTTILAGTSNNTYSGLTQVNAGALNIQHAGALGTTAAGTVVANTARLELQGGITVTGEAITLTGSGGNFFGALQSKSGTNTWAGNVIIAADATRIGAQAGSTLDVSGVIDSGANVYNVTFRPADTTATVVVSGANTYIGSTAIVGGPVKVSTINKVVGGSATSNLGAPTTVAAGTISLGLSNAAGTLVYTGAGETTDRVINFAGTTGGGGIDQSGAGVLKFTSDLTATGLGAKTLTLQGSTAGSGEISGAIVDNSIVNTTAVTKTGSGIWKLSGTNTYTGPTNITGGTLLVNNTTGSGTGSGTVTVAVGATDSTAVRLGGNGTISGATSFAADPNLTGTDVGGIHSPGDPAVSDGVGKQTFTAASDSVTYNTGSIFEWNLAASPLDNTSIDGFGTGARGTDYDAVNATALGTTTGAIFRVVLNGAQDFTESFWNTNREWSDIFKTADAGSALGIGSIFSGTIQYYNGGGGTLASLGDPTAEGQFTISGTSLNWTAVPEPTSALAGLLIAAGLLRRRRPFNR